MAKSFIDVVQDSPRTDLGIPVKNITPSLGPYFRSRNRLSALNFISGWSGLKVVLRLFHYQAYTNPTLPAAHPRPTPYTLWPSRFLVLITSVIQDFLDWSMRGTIALSSMSEPAAWKTAPLASKLRDQTLVSISKALVDTDRYTEIILITVPLCAEDGLLWIAWLPRVLAQWESNYYWSPFLIILNKYVYLETRPSKNLTTRLS